MNQHNKLLITGASGFTGYHACKHFFDSGFDVTAVSRRNAFTHNGINWINCDLSHKESVKSLIKTTKPQYVLHLAGQNHVGQSWLNPVYSLEINSLSTAYLIDALRQENPSCKIVITSSALQFDPTSISTFNHPYGLSKTIQSLIAQSFAVLYDMNVVIAKPSNLIGPGHSKGVCSIFAQKIIDMEKNKTENVLKVNNINDQRDFLDVRDAVSAYDILLMKGKPGEIYDVSSGKSRSLGEIINILKKMTLVDFKVHSLLNDEIKKDREVEPLKLVKLNWKPVISLESSLKDILNFYRGNDKGTSYL
ncbi:NAD-dependent epimerase/dehydratase family protein [Priestia megaterium]|uniref:NAD-dependent epimerase/dehydratase family protein n=1 Tax=Priestia megaterium TaxID=1404 RepID=UPI002A6AFD84|nr:NAD-dependent epimerase/dehydratase family protein [Priestia megaterium]MDY0943743.1 NAD-dependent epimerase/dehydratase family protein [Priestia megaterium]